MLSRSISVLFALIFLFAVSGYGQLIQPDWSDAMHDANLTFDELVNEHQYFWPVRPTQRGQGFKQFERFKSLQQSRLRSDGHILSGSDVLHSWQEVQSFQASRSLSGNWYSLGPIIDDVTSHQMIEGVGRMTSIAFHPTNPDVLFAGSPAGGLWRSFDGGQSWSTNTDWLPTLGISSIAFDPTNPDLVYAGTGDRDAADSPGMGVMKSTDGGETWTFVNTGISALTVGCIRIQPETGNVYIGTDDGLFMSTNQGDSWEMISTNSSGYKDFEFHPTNGQIIYSTASGKFYRSENGGVDWTWVTDVIGTNARMNIAVTPAAPDVVYVIKTSTYAFTGFYKSTDAGVTFTEMSTSPNIMGWAADGTSTGGQAWYDLCMDADRENPDIVYVGGIRLKKSLDGGATWMDINPNYVHVDQHELVVSPHNHDLYVCNDGGLYQYANNEEWKDISSGLVVGEIYQLGQSPFNPNHTLNGFQDNGTMEYDGVYWRRRGGGDGFECAYDFSDPNYRYGSIYYGEIYRTTPEVVNEKICAQDVLGITEEGAWNSPFILGNGDAGANTMFVGLKNVWRSVNIKDPVKDSIHWTKISDNLFSNTSNINEMENCLSNSNIVYLAKDNRKLFRSNNALAENPTWVNLSVHLPVFQMPVNAIETNPLDSNLLYICFNNKVYRSPDQGMTWTDISGALPSVATNTIVLDTTNAGIEALYVGTDMGVYYKDTTMTGFVPFNTGLPLSARITELEIYYGATPAMHRIKASTYGRGLWEGDLYSAQDINFPAVAAMTISNPGNEVFGNFDVNILFYKSLNEANVTSFDDISNDIEAINATVQSITGGPSMYTATISPQNFGVVKLVVPQGAAIDMNGLATFNSDTLSLVYADAPELLGPDGPGGVGDANSLTFWLRADMNTTLNNGAVQSWNDVSGSGYSAQQAAPEKMPLLQMQGINNLPALSFDGSNDILQMSNVVPGKSISAFIMVETDTIKFNDHGWFASSRVPNGYLMHPWKNDYYYHNEVLDLNGDYSGINSFYIGDASAPHIYGFSYHQDDIHQVMTTVFDDDRYPQPGVNIGARDNTTSINIDIGHDYGYDDSRFGKGRIAEHFVYSSRLMESQIRIVSNYMASKYGIDLGPIALYNHPEQSLEVIGIGRESAYDRHTAAKGLGIIKLMNASSLDDGDYLLIGNDSAALDVVTNYYPFISPRVQRTWAYQETGDAGTVTLRVDPSQIASLTSPGIIFTSGDEFTTSSSLTFIPLMIQGPVMEAQIDFPASGVFTIGSEPQLGIQDLNFASALIYPNPAQDFIQVEIKKAWPQKWNVLVYDSFGKLVMNQTCSGKKAQMDISALSSGLYTMDVVIDNEVIERTKIIKL